jgi:2TM domain-containing protein
MISAIRRDRELFLFVIHFAVFIVGVAVAAAINHWRSPDTLWWPWVLIGWGAAVATHGFALLLRKAHRRERIFIDPKARAFAVHLFAYLATVLILFYVNLTMTSGRWWFYWVALGWGVGVAFQGWCVFWKHRRKSPKSAAPQAASATPLTTHTQPKTPTRSKTRTPSKTSRKSSSTRSKRRS